jgi:cytochrome c oxidase subunit II
MKRSRRSLFILISLIAVLSILLAACGGGEDDENDIGDAPIASPTPAGVVEATTPPEVADTDGDPEAGRALWQAQCMACHTIDGSAGLGPTWQGLWMAEVPLDDGTTVTGDEAYITESIREPNAKIHDDFQAVMPAFDLDDDEIADIIAFIQTIAN